MLYKVDIKQHNCFQCETKFLMFLEHVISEESCETEGCLKIQLKKIYIKVYICNNISQFYSFYCIFDQINAALSIREDT